MIDVEHIFSALAPELLKTALACFLLSFLILETYRSTREEQAPKHQQQPKVITLLPTEHKTSFLEIQEFNHLAREVINAKVTRDFYIKYLGAREIARPPFEADGFWLHCHGLNLHLVQSKRVEERKGIKDKRMKYFKHAFLNAQEPSVDHFAFVCRYDIEGLQKCEESLSRERLEYFKFGGPDSLTGITQIFVFDPDGNVVEISDCAPPCGMVKCMRKQLGGDPSRMNVFQQDEDMPELSKASNGTPGGFWGE